MDRQTLMLIQHNYPSDQDIILKMYKNEGATKFSTTGNLRLINKKTTIGELTFTSSQDKLIIEEIFVKSSFHGRGFGTHLLKLAETFAAEHGLHQVILKPSPIDTMKLMSLKDWYRRRGYTSCGLGLMRKPVG